ncbi:MAG: type II toxin-antitoxin system VapC family toxin [Planctomycetota bacterium]|nr:type II toxin-antitoxin system VapC family toxin [Planctomycetota bacterium]
MKLVVDASVALSWVLPDENAQYPNAALEQVIAEGAAVPSIWPAEIANGLLMAVRRKRIEVDRVPRALLLFESLRIEVDSRGARESVRHVFDAGWASGLTAYDASYLDLCLRSGLVLATQDDALARAAKRAGAAVFQGKGPGGRA